MHQPEHSPPPPYHARAEGQMEVVEQKPRHIEARLGAVIPQHLQHARLGLAVVTEFLHPLVAALLVLLHFPRDQAFLHALGALGAPPQARHALGKALLEIARGPPLGAHRLDQGGKLRRVLAQGPQRLLPLLRVKPVAQMRGAAALLALRRVAAPRDWRPLRWCAVLLLSVMGGFWMRDIKTS